MEYLSLALRLKNMAPSQYINYNFNSMAVFRGQSIGASEAGLHLLESGNLDVATVINSLLELVKTDFGVTNPKRIIKVLFGYMSTGELSATITSDDKISVSSTLPASQKNLEQHGDFALARSLGRYIGLRIQNTKGCDFSLDDIKISVILSPTRRLVRV